MIGNPLLVAGTSTGWPGPRSEVRQSEYDCVRRRHRDIKLIGMVVSSRTVAVSVSTDFLARL